ncbi:MAG: CDP-alcohol phosphatidyltransferase family protein [Aeromicrobium sp.]|uniref:CDP-alcohol phosphatidyltransferase family protein n=1 Tax=Aeromicrobium sp. TaxID=1871063 RepID=UPI002616BB6A|nr:CDP-alcohol phosphatidyltransferase family protein [Aeromicrobium sp.]MDF1704077.1 CDP-alcohol phosphatidyltransferase family protein [Aeromicrobium sp.]
MARTPVVADGIGPLLTVPNAITVVRTVVSLALALVALQSDDRLPWVVAAYLVYYLGDSADGLAARLLGQETRAGAVHDILSDRLCTAVCAANLILLQPDLAVPVGIFLLNFMVLDCLLSLSFLLWPIVSPNYFAVVDDLVYRLNWSHPAKALNNIGIIAAVVVGSLPLALVIVIAQLSVKVWSARRVVRRIRELEASREVAV